MPEPPAPASDAPLFHLVLHTARLLEASLRDQLEPHGLHHGQGRVLDALASHPDGLSQVQIARGLHIRETAATQVVRRLHDLELVRRIADPDDARAFRITLTATGRRAAARLRTSWTRTEQQLTAGMSADARRDARRLLHTLRANLGGADPSV